jgi:hypothetical protein
MIHGEGREPGQVATHKAGWREAGTAIVIAPPNPMIHGESRNPGQVAILNAGWREAGTAFRDPTAEPIDPR